MRLPHRILPYFLLTALTLTAGLLAARPPAPSTTPSAKEKQPSRPPAVVCLGHVDVEGGLTSLAPAQPGRVVALGVREGETVAAGAVLLRLDDQPARFAAEQARAALDAARARLTRAEQDRRQQPVRAAQMRAAIESAEFRLATEQHHLTRQKELFRINNTSEQEVRAVESQVKDLEAQVRAARERLAEFNLSDPELPVREAQAEVAAAEARLRQAEYAIGQCELRAPAAGTVLRALVNPGEVVGGPSAVAPLLFCPDQPFVVRAEVEQEFVGRVSAGQPARVQDEAAPGASWSGRVARIAGWYAHQKATLEKPSAFKDVPTVECLIRLDERRPPLRIGQRVQVAVGGE